LTRLHHDLPREGGGEGKDSDVPIVVSDRRKLLFSSTLSVLRSSFPLGEETGLSYLQDAEYSSDVCPSAEMIPIRLHVSSIRV